MATTQRISKSRFRRRALEYFRQVEQTRRELVITDRGKPVLKIVPVGAGAANPGLSALRGTLKRYDRPTEPVGEHDWDALK